MNDTQQNPVSIDLQKAADDVIRHVRFVNKYRNDDPSGAMNHARIATEAICLYLISAHRNAVLPPKQDKKEENKKENLPKTLKAMIEKLAGHESIIPEYILNHALTLLNWGNSGSHHHVILLAAEDIHSALIAFNRLTRWFFESNGLSLDPADDVLLIAAPQTMPFAAAEKLSKEKIKIPKAQKVPPRERIRLRILLTQYSGKIQFLFSGLSAPTAPVYFDPAPGYYDILFDRLKKVIAAVNNIYSHSVEIQCALPDKPQLCAPQKFLGHERLDPYTLDFSISCRLPAYIPKPPEYSIEIYDDCCLRINREGWLRSLFGNADLSSFNIDERRLARAVKQLASYTYPGYIAKGQTHFNKINAHSRGEYYLSYWFERSDDEQNQLAAAQIRQGPRGAVVPLQKPSYTDPCIRIALPMD